MSCKKLIFMTENISIDQNINTNKLSKVHYTYGDQNRIVDINKLLEPE